MKRFLSMFMCMIMIFTMLSAFSACFANGIADINIKYTEAKYDATNKKVTSPESLKIGKLNDDGTDIKENEFDWNHIFVKYKNVITGISGVAALTFLVFFIINFMKLGGSSGNPQQRNQAMMGIVWCGIACAGLGGIAIFFGFFYNALS